VTDYDCPRCGYGIDAQTEFKHGAKVGAGMPGPGDVLVCVYCSGIGVVEHDGTTVRPADPEERLMFMQQSDVQGALTFAYQFQRQRKREGR
jgi:hypothetical protein